MMRKVVCSAVTATFVLMGSLPGQAADIEWSPAFEIETDADIDLSGTIVRAVNVADPNVVDIIEVIFPGDIAVEFEPEHTFEFVGGSVTGGGNYYTGDGELTTENVDLDAVFDDHGWVSGGPGVALAELELADLVVGETYQIQLIGAADDRSCCEYRQMQVITDDFEPVNEDIWFGRSNDFDQDGERGPGSVIGVFTADATEQYIYITGTADFDDGDGGFGDGNDPGLSAYILSLAGGGGPGIRGDFNGDGELTAADIDDLTQQSAAGQNPTQYDLTGDGLVNEADVAEWINAPDIYNSWVGDANLDKEFSSADLVVVLASGAYETGAAAVWSTGDFNGDGLTTSGDLVAGLAGGGYEAGPRAAVAAVPEPSSLALLLSSLLALAGWKRHR